MNTLRSEINFWRAVVSALGFLLSATLGSASEHRSHAAQQEMHSPYWYLDPQTDPFAELTNNNHAARVVELELLVGGSQPVIMGETVLDPFSTRRIPLRPYLAFLPFPRAFGSEWGNATRPESRWGAAILRGESLKGIQGWVVSENRAEGLVANSPFERCGHATGQTSAAWWAPTPQTRLLLAIQNPSETAVSFSTHISTSKDSRRQRRFAIAARSAILLDGRALGLPAELRSGYVEIDPDDSGSVLHARGTVVDDARGYSVSLVMHHRRVPLTSVLNSPGLPLGRGVFPGLEDKEFRISIVMGNRTSRELSVVPQVFVEGERAAVAEDALSPTRLRPGEIRTLTLGSRDIFGTSANGGIVGLALVHDGSPGAVVAHAIASEDSLNHVFTEHLYESGSTSAFHFSTSFDLRGTRQKILLARNVGDRSGLLQIGLHYETARGWTRQIFGPWRVEPNQSRAVNVRELRDSCCPGHLRSAASARSRNRQRLDSERWPSVGHI